MYLTGRHKFKEGEKMFRNARKPISVWLLILIDILLIAIGLLVFAYFHHVRPKEDREPDNVYIPPQNTKLPGNNNTDPTGLPTLPSTNTVATTGDQYTTLMPTAEPTTPIASETPPPPDYSYLGLGEKFYDKFNLDGSVTKTDDSYVSGRVAVYISKVRYNNSNCYVADIYLCDITSFRTVLGNDKYNGYEKVGSMLSRNNAIVGTNGDFFAIHGESFVIRNGAMYYDPDKAKIDSDICVLYGNGEMISYQADKFDPQAAIQKGAWQAWTFGPKLISDGKAVTSGYSSFYSGILGKNPRTALGYYEPGHYCFVCVDGRSSESPGLKLDELAAFMSELGCVDAFNLDGGQSSEMWFGGENINVRSGDRYRNQTDAVMIVDR